MEFAIQSFFHSWIDKHPLITWLLQHPIISLVSIFLIVVLLFRLFAAIVQLLDKLWIWLLKLPLVLIKSIFGLKSKPSKAIPVIRAQELAIEPEKISQIIQQLEIINQQQQQIMEELATLKHKLS